MTQEQSTVTLEDLANMSEEEFSKVNPASLLQESEEQVQEVPEQDTTSNESPVYEQQETTQEVVVQDVDHSAFYSKVTSTFKANGKEHQIDNPDDVIKLMQMGLNYNQKMNTLKPDMHLVKALKDAGVYSLDQLGELIDLKNKDPKAIAKLVVDSGIDTYELNEDNAKEYSPTILTVDEQRSQWDDAVDRCKAEPNFDRVYSDLRGVDIASQQQVYDNPALLELLVDHANKGYYGKIVGRMQQLQALGQLPANTNFLEAYDRIGNGLFSTPEPVEVPTPQTKQVDNTARKAAMSTQPNTQATQASMTPEDIWNLSDAEFAKLDPKSL